MVIFTDPGLAAPFHESLFSTAAYSLWSPPFFSAPGPSRWRLESLFFVRLSESPSIFPFRWPYMHPVLLLLHARLPASVFLLRAPKGFDKDGPASFPSPQAVISPCFFLDGPPVPTAITEFLPISPRFDVRYSWPSYQPLASFPSLSTLSPHTAPEDPAFFPPLSFRVSTTFPQDFGNS